MKLELGSWLLLLLFLLYKQEKMENEVQKQGMSESTEITKQVQASKPQQNVVINLEGRNRRP